MKKYPKIKRLGHRKTEGILENGEVTILEKMDGNNFRVTYDAENEKLLFGSRNVEFKANGIPFDYDSDEIGGQFEDVTRYIYNNIEGKERLSNYVMFGENMVEHTLDYDREETPQWLVFAVFDKQNHQWLEWGEVEQFADKFGFETVPYIGTKDVDEFREEFDADNVDKIIPDSQYRNGGLAEGIVLRNGSRRAKVLSEEFKEKHSNQTGGKHPDETLDDTVQLVQMYATDGRIKKHINKLVVDQGKELEMSLMEDLPMKVVDDIFEEEYEEMVRSRKTIDFKKFRSKVADKCVRLLKKRIREEAVSSDGDRNE